MRSRTCTPRILSSLLWRDASKGCGYLILHYYGGIIEKKGCGGTSFPSCRIKLSVIYASCAGDFNITAIRGWGFLAEYITRL